MMRQQSIGWLACLMFTVALMVSGPSGAQEQQPTPQQEQAQRQLTQPGNNAPFWREARGRDTVGGTVGNTTVRGRETGVLIQSEGQQWRELRNGPLTQVGGWLLALAFVGVLLFFAVKGTVRLHEPETGRKIVRFSLWERVIHWTTAITFLILAFTGLSTLFGRYLVIPLIGHSAFSWIAAASKLLHNFIGPLFIVCTLAIFFTFVRDNIWRKYDGEWVRRAGGLLSRGHTEPRSGRFNAGEKAWFWGGVSLLGIVVGLSGLVLDFPNFDQSRQVMQTANVVHLIGAVLFMAAAIGHIYMGTLGMAGAYDAMTTGVVDETWAKEHHYYWYEDVRAGRVAQPGEEPGRPLPPGATRVEY
jgi:formate dehydrogenase subunit gamma